MTDNKHWIYLEQLRRGGTINMFEAIPYIMHEFHVTRPRAAEILVTWMRNYNRKDYEA